MSDLLTNLAGTLVKQGAPVLGGIIGSAIGGPAGTAIGGMAGKALETLGEVLGVPATPEAVTAATQSPAAGPAIHQAEEQTKLLLPLWSAEAARLDQAQAAEIERGFGSWQFWRGAWQALIIGGWALILLTGIFGGGWIVPLLPFTEIVTAWGSVTLTWLAVFNGGHTLKEIAPAIGFGRKAR